MMAAAELFETVLVEQDAPCDPRIAQLIWWAARFAELGFTPSYGPGDHGNLSCRAPHGLIITARQTNKARLIPDQFVEVINGPAVLQAGAPIECRGLRLPSTDTLMHVRIYALRPELQAILHGHDHAALAKADRLHIPVTRISAATPSLALIDEVCGLAREHDYLLMRDHGFLALGRSIDDAGELVRTINARARSLLV